MTWAHLRRLFVASLVLYVTAAVILKMLIYAESQSVGFSSKLVALYNLHLFLVDVPGVVCIASGSVLLGRWLILNVRTWWASFHREAEFKSAPVVSKYADGLSENSNHEKWNALVQFDSEIRTVVDRLRPFGGRWIDEFEKAYFALEENRKYLPDILERLLTLAQTEQNRETAKLWAEKFAKTACGETTSKDSIIALQRLVESGFKVEIEENFTFVASKNGVKSFMRSNNDIVRTAASLLRKK